MDSKVIATKLNILGQARRGYHHGNLKEVLIEAARVLIAQKGPTGFTLAEAAKLAGVTAAAPYRHFTDRNALLLELARRGFGQFADCLETAWDKGQPDPLTAFLNTGPASIQRCFPVSPRSAHSACATRPLAPGESFSSRPMPRCDSSAAMKARLI